MKKPGMYNYLFGFCEGPFENRLDQRFLFLGRDHGEVLAALLYFSQEKKGLAMICGDVGTGKTMLLHGFLSKLPPSVQPIVITNPMVNYRELLSYIARALEIPRRDETLLELLDHIRETLHTAHEQGKTVILIIDEAHLLSDTSLEHVRLLSNLETQECKLLQILLVGQTELSHRLNQPGFRQLRQRINVNRFLPPLSPGETVDYVEHRLGRVGSPFDRCFSPKCKKLIWQLTGGAPRLINQLCDTALLICLSEGLAQVNPKTLRKARNALGTDQIFTAGSAGLPGKADSYAKKRKFWVPALGCLLLLALWGMPWPSGFQEGTITIFQEFWSRAAGFCQSRKPSTEISGESSSPAVPAPATDKAPSLAAAAPAPAGPKADVSTLNQEAPLPLTPAKPVEISSPPTSPDSGVEAEKPTLGRATEEEDKIVKPAPEGQDGPSPPEAAKETVAAAALTKVQAPRPRQVEVEANDNLSRIAERWFPDQVNLGLLALLMANPQNRNANLIFPGQKLNLPQIDPDNQTIQMQEGVFYALWGTYPNIHSLQETIAKLSQQNVRYTVMKREFLEGNSLYQVLIGAYGGQEDLEQALSRVKGANR
jgi:type II secretory pathway predicted ATPase ExeA